MAASDKQRLKLEKDFLNAKNEDVMTLDEKLEKLKQITAVER